MRYYIGPVLFFLICTAIFVASVWSEPDVVQITVDPYVVWAGAAIRLRCIVARHPDNRWLTFGIEDYTDSARQIDGERGATIYDALIQHVPCDAGPAFCEVTRLSGRVQRATANLIVSGC